MTLQDHVIKGHVTLGVGLRQGIITLVLEI